MGWDHKDEDCDDKNKSCDNCEKSNECHIYEINKIFDNSIGYDETTERDVEDVKRLRLIKRVMNFV